MRKVDNYSRLAITKSVSSHDSEHGGAKITHPELMPPRAIKAVAAKPLSEENLRKRQAYTGDFIKHMLRFTVSFVTFGLSVTAAVMSGGTGIPLAVATGTAMVIAAGDACCALYNLIQIRNDRSPLHTGNDSVVMAVKALMIGCGCTDSGGEIIGDVASFSLRVGIALSCVFLPSAHLPDSTVQTISKISMGITAFITIAGGGIDIVMAHVGRMLRSHTDHENSDLLISDEIKEMVNSLVDAYELTRAQRNEPEGICAW